MVGIQLGLRLGFRKSTCRDRPGLLRYGYGLRLVLGFVLWLWQTFGVADVNHFLQLTDVLPRKLCNYGCPLPLFPSLLLPLSWAHIPLNPARG